MEVLTEVDRDRIAALRARDEFFWLDLTRRSDADLDMAGELLGLHALALEDTREFGQRPKLDRYRDAVLLVFYSARANREGKPRRADRGAPAHLGRLPVHRPRRRLRRRSTGSTRRSTPDADETEDYIVYRVLDALTDALFPVVDRARAAHRRARGARCSSAPDREPAQPTSTGSSRRSSRSCA